jgi:hypothetical protein
MKAVITILTLIISTLTLSAQNFKVDYDYTIQYDNNWDTTLHNGSLKTRQLIIPTCEMTEIEVKFTSEIKDIIKNESKSELSRLTEIYKDEGFPDQPEMKFSGQTCFKTDNSIIAIISHTVNFEYAEIATILLIHDDSVYLFSTSNKLGVEMDIKCLIELEDKLVVYGTSQGNPEVNCGGNYQLEFVEGKRLISYEYCEENK